MVIQKFSDMLYFGKFKHSEVDMNSAICFHGKEITCDMVSPEHADAMGFIYRESEIKPVGEAPFGTDWAEASFALWEVV